MSLLTDADALINGPRQEQYGSPEENFRNIGVMWGMILKTPPVAPAKVAMMMVALKLARQANQHKRDNLVDIAGYVGLADRLGGER